jgi:hypothetical protein
MVLVLSLAVPVPAAGPAGLVPADILSMETMGHFILSPDGENLRKRKDLLKITVKKGY